MLFKSSKRQDLLKTSFHIITSTYFTFSNIYTFSFYFLCYNRLRQCIYTKCREIDFVSLPTKTCSGVWISVTLYLMIKIWRDLGLGNNDLSANASASFFVLGTSAFIVPCTSVHWYSLIVSEKLDS